jgi:hypothetical protein
MNIDLKKLLLQTVFAFILFMMPTVALEPQDDSIYTVSDFFVYYTQAHMLVKNPRCDVYSEVPLMTTAAELFPPLKTHGWYLVGEPPVSLAFLIPLFLLPASFSLWIYKTFLVICMSISLALLVQIFELNERQFQLAAILIALSGPLWEATRVTKPGIIVLLALTLCLLALKNKKPLTAALLFLPWTFKPQLIVMFFVELLAARKFKFIAMMVIATLILIVVTLPLLGIDNYQQWLLALKYGTEHPEINAPFLHPTVRGQLMRFASMPESIIKIVVAVGFITAQVVALVIGHLARSKKDWLRIIVMILPLSVVCSPYCHIYDLVLLIPSVIAFVTAPGLKSMKRPARITCYTIASLCLLVYELPLYNRIHYDYLQKGILTVSPLFCSLLIASILCVFVAFRETRQPEDSTSNSTPPA